MTTFERVRSFFKGLFMLAMGIVMVMDTDTGMKLAMLFIGVSLLLTGIRNIWFFFTMARNMVGGRTTLYLGIIILDLGAFTLSLSDSHIIYIIIYLLIFYAFSGFVDIMRGLEAKKIAAPAWKLHVLHGVIYLGIVVVCLLFIHTTEAVVDIFSVGVIIIALQTMADAFRRTSIVYVA